MSGAFWAVASGVGFGVFQALNGRAARDLDNVYLSTFLQILIACAILVVASLATGELEAIGGAPVSAIVAFAGAGLVHFFVGWTLLNTAHHRLGAARTSPLLSSSPIFGLAIAAVFASQVPGLLQLGGIALAVCGAWVITEPAGAGRGRLRDYLFALGTACSWAVSAVITLEGLERLDSPLLGVTIGMFASLLAFGILLLSTGTRFSLGREGGVGLAFKLLAGTAVAVALWMRWIALDNAEVAVVLALNLVSVPVVLLGAPLVSGRQIERVTPKLWGGAALIIAGMLLLIVRS